MKLVKKDIEDLELALQKMEQEKTNRDHILNTMTEEVAHTDELINKLNKEKKHIGATRNYQAVMWHGLCFSISHLFPDLSLFWLSGFI